MAWRMADWMVWLLGNLKEQRMEQVKARMMVLRSDTLMDLNLAEKSAELKVQ